jgi:mannose-6-phosphate isomerase
MNRLYPLKFKPLFKDKIWGGQRINTVLGMNFSPLPNCGEAWVLSGVKGSETKVSNGFLKGNTINELVGVFMDDLLGERAFEKFRTEFPILVKFIDSNEYLSVQVHPDDKLAARRNLGNGKTELWYILEAEANAELINGFNRKLDRRTYLEYFNNKQLKDILHFEKVHKGDVFFIPSGRVHALGPGILLAEIQQTSDTTYRIYDWDRTDDKGNSRELHTELALDAIDFGVPGAFRTHYSGKANEPANLVTNPSFCTDFISFTRPVQRNYKVLDSFVILVCVSGSAVVKEENCVEDLKTGEVMLIPTVLGNLVLEPKGECKLLEVYIT